MPVGNDGVPNSGRNAHDKGVRTKHTNVTDEAHDDAHVAVGGKRVGVNEQFNATPLTNHDVREVTEEDTACGERAVNVDSASIEVAVLNDETASVVALGDGLEKSIVGGRHDKGLFAIPFKPLNLANHGGEVRPSSGTHVGDDLSLNASGGGNTSDFRVRGVAEEHGSAELVGNVGEERAHRDSGGIGVAHENHVAPNGGESTELVRSEGDIADDRRGFADCGVGIRGGSATADPSNRGVTGLSRNRDRSASESDRKSVV